MSNIIQPWIRTHLIYVAENYGGDLLTVPLEPKNKKVQVIEFLTPHVVGKDSWVWAVISDKFHAIPVRFSKQAIQEFETHGVYAGNSLSGYKTAVLSIKSFRPMFARIPGPNGMRPTPQLVLDIGEFSLYGSPGQPVYGTPKPVESDESIREWSEGLSVEGGGGNVLKLRRIEREKASSASNKGDGQSPNDVPKRIVLPVLQSQPANTSKSLPTGIPVGAPHLKNKQGKPNNRKAWSKRWRLSTRNIYSSDIPETASSALARPVSIHSRRNIATNEPDPQAEYKVQSAQPARTTTPRKKRPHALDMFTPESSPPTSLCATGASADRHFTSPDKPDSARPTTPSEWSPSTHVGSQLLSSPVRMEVDEEEVFGGVSSEESEPEPDIDGPSSRPTTPAPVNNMEIEADTKPEDAKEPNGGADVEVLVSPSIPFPTPAQRLQALRAEADGRALSLPAELDVPDSQSSPTRFAMDGRSSSLPVASELVILSQTRSEDLSPQVLRKRRAPVLPFRVPPDFSVGKILVPNSDSSQSLSQSQSQSAAFASQSQRDGQDRGLLLTGPQQSLSYTSLSQSQSQSNGQTQEHSRSAAGSHLPEASQTLEVAADSVDEHRPGAGSQPVSEEHMDVDEEHKERKEPAAAADSLQSPPESAVPPRENEEITEKAVIDESLDPRSSPAYQSQDEHMDASGEDDANNQSIEDDDEEHDLFELSSDEAEVGADRQNVEGATVDEPKGGDLDSDDVQTRDKIHRSKLCTPSKTLSPTPKTPRDRSSTSRAAPSGNVTPGRLAPYVLCDRRNRTTPVSSPSKSHQTSSLPVLPAVTADGQRDRHSTVARHSPNGPQTTEKSPVPTHDAEAWRQPSFLHPREGTDGKKRNISPSADDERPRKKSRKPSRSDMPTDTPPLENVSEPGTSSSHIKQKSLSRSLQKVDSLRSTTSRLKRIDLAHDSPVSPSSAAKRPSHNSEPPPKDRASTSTSREKSGMRDSASGVTGHTATGGLRSSAKGKAKAITSTLESASLENVHSLASAPSRSLGLPPAIHTGSSDNRTRSSTQQAPTAGAASDTHRHPSVPRGKLGGFKLDLTMIPNDNGPPLMTWKTLTDILLLTGRARHKEHKQRELVRDSS